MVGALWAFTLFIVVVLVLANLLSPAQIGVSVLAVDRVRPQQCCELFEEIAAAEVIILTIHPLGKVENRAVEVTEPPVYEHNRGLAFAPHDPASLGWDAFRALLVVSGASSSRYLRTVGGEKSNSAASFASFQPFRQHEANSAARSVPGSIAGIEVFATAESYTQGLQKSTDSVNFLQKMLCMAKRGVGERLRKAMDEKPGGRIRPTDLARQLSETVGEKITPQRLGNWLNDDKEPSTNKILEAMADILDVNVDWLIGENIPMRDPTKKLQRPVYRTGTRWVPIYGAISAGSPASNQGDVVEWLEMREWGGDFERWGRVVEGFSMEPYLRAGDFAIFENRQWEPGHAVHAYDDGEDTVKVAKRVKGVLRLYPTNPDYEPIDAESWHVKGVCASLSIERSQMGKRSCESSETG